MSLEEKVAKMRSETREKSSGLGKEDKAAILVRGRELLANGKITREQFRRLFEHLAGLKPVGR